MTWTTPDLAAGASEYDPGMGWIKNAKADSMLKDAQDAWNEGSVVFTPVMNLPAWRLGFSGRNQDWELMIGAILSVGWRLQAWAVSSDKEGRPQAMPLFVR